MPKVFCVLLAFSSAWLANPACAVEVVRVGAAHFPPYTVRPEKGDETGLLPQLLDALNAVQRQYLFVLVPTSIPRRFRDFQEQRIDMAIFENPAWGWTQIAHDSVDMGLEDAEIFVTHRIEGRDEGYFAELKGKRLALFNGYHYAFADFNPSPKYLIRHYQATLTYNHDSNLSMVQRDRADIALVTRSYLSDYARREPASAAELLASQRVDQVYRHYALLRPRAPISAEAFGRLLQQLREDGQLLKIFQAYQITVSTPPAS